MPWRIYVFVALSVYFLCQIRQLSVYNIKLDSNHLTRLPMFSHFTASLFLSLFKFQKHWNSWVTTVVSEYLQLSSRLMGLEKTFCFSEEQSHFVNSGAGGNKSNGLFQSQCESTAKSSRWWKFLMVCQYYLNLWQLHGTCSLSPPSIFHYLVPHSMHFVRSPGFEPVS